MYQERQGYHVCSYFQNHGIRLRLEQCKREKTNLYFLRMIVNPRKLIDPDSSYLGIFPATKDAVRMLKEAFYLLFDNTPVDNDINQYMISRLDYCCNIRCNKNTVFREMVRVLRKLPTPPKYARIYHHEKDKKKENMYNKHYIKFTCGTHALVIYDKTFQMKEEGISVGYEDFNDGVIRFEVQCNRDYLRQKSKAQTDLNTTDLIWHFTKNSRKTMIKHFAQCFDDVSFIHLDKAIEKISRSRYSNEIKEHQKALMTELKRKQSVDAAVKNLNNLKKKDKKKLLNTFATLGFSPIPLRENFKADSLFSPVFLLKAICTEDLFVEYDG